MTDHEHDMLAMSFERDRGHLRAVAYRMLGSRTEADDAVQEAWLRLSRADTTDVANLGGWLTTVVSRVCLDMLRTRTSRREEPLDVREHDAGTSTDPIHDEMLADSVGSALFVVLETLAPAERLAFVLHDLFAVPFDDIATIVGRSPAATRQLASRARRRVQGATPDGGADRERNREIVDAFLAASRDGDFEALLAVLDPEVVLRADSAAVLHGATAEVRGARAVAETFRGRAKAARSAWLDGAAGAAWAVGGETRVAFSFTMAEGRITAIDLLAEPEVLGEMEIVFVPLVRAAQ